MKRYDKYKDSGVEWIGEIPVHWEMLSNKYIFKLTKSQVGKKSADFELLSLTLKGIIKRDMENPEGKFPAEFDTYQKVKKGDFVFCLFDVEETPRTVGLSDFNGMITGAYTVFTGSPKTDSKYLFYFYLNLDEKKRLKFLYRGLRNTIPKDSFFSFKTTFPPLPEQQAIASFLDDKTAKIDQTISIKEKEIELLKERRQILIQKAVTKGLDDKVKLKDSGVEWIGEIPEHWEIRKLRYLGQTQNGISKSGDFFGKGNPFLSYGDVYKNSQIPSNFDGLVESTINEIKQYSVKEGDIFFTRTSETKDDIGVSSVCYKDIDNATFAGFLIRFRPHKNQLIKSFSKYYFRTNLIGSFFTKEMNLVTRASLSQELLKSLSVILPPIKEQFEIGLHLEKIDSKISKIITLKQQEIEKLKEYKTVLIDNVVTGKVKVS